MNKTSWLSVSGWHWPIFLSRFLASESVLLSPKCIKQTSSNFTTNKYHIRSFDELSLDTFFFSPLLLLSLWGEETKSWLPTRAKRERNITRSKDTVSKIQGSNATHHSHWKKRQFILPRSNPGIKEIKPNIYRDFGRTSSTQSQWKEKARRARLAATSSVVFTVQRLVLRVFSSFKLQLITM